MRTAFAALPHSRVNPEISGFVTRTMTQSNTRTVFFISDGTGITAETLGTACSPNSRKAASVRCACLSSDNLDKAIDCATQIREAAESDGVRPIVFNTLVNPDSVDVIRKSNALFLDLFEKFIVPLKASSASGQPTQSGAFMESPTVSSIKTH